MISFKAPAEGAWDPDVEYGANRFLVTWEERLGPQFINILSYITKEQYPG